MNITIADTLIKGLNNPDCSFYVGNMVGQLTIMQMIVKLGLAYLCIKFIEKWIILPVYEYVTRKIRKKEDKKND